MVPGSSFKHADYVRFQKTVTDETQKFFVLSNDIYFSLKSHYGIGIHSALFTLLKLSCVFAPKCNEWRGSVE